MSFPLDILTELQISGVWTPALVRAASPVRIRAGRGSEGSRTTPGTCTLTLDNRSGVYSPRNPRSPYYGLIGRNTPMRVSVPGAPVALVVTQDQQTQASTPDTPVLDLTGDLDIRCDVAMGTWDGLTATTELVSKWDQATEVSWTLSMSRDGKIGLFWSSDGGFFAPGAKAVLSDPVGLAPGERRTVRATLDVDNNVGGHTVTFWLGDSVDGPWTQHGDQVTTTGTTSVYASTAPVEVGDSAGIVQAPSTRRIYAAQIRNGIDGPVVANPDFQSQAPGTTVFADPAGLTWTVAGGDQVSGITDRQVEFAGEVTSWPQHWDLSGADAWTPVTASGIMRRLGQGAAALESTLRRRIPAYSPLAYWPLEDGASTTQAYSPLPGVQPLVISGELDFGQATGLPGSNPLPAWGEDAQATGSVPAPPTATEEWRVEMVYDLDELPTGLNTLLEVRTTGTARRLSLRVSADDLRVYTYDRDNAEFLLIDLVGPLLGFTGQWSRLTLAAYASGGTVTVRVAWIKVDGSAAIITDTYPGTVGRVTSVTVLGIPTGLSAGHLSVWDQQDTDAYALADHGYTGETASARIDRLAEEEQVQVVLVGDSGGTTAMGPQLPAPLMDLLEEAAASDGGILSEQSDALALRYRSRASLYNQRPAIVLDYTASGEVPPGLEPIDDDLATRNDVTITRLGGSSGRAVLETGGMSVLAPPDGIGRTSEVVSLSLAEDAQTDQAAGWRLHLGTVDEARYPSVTINLLAAPHLIPAVLAMGIGDRVQIINPPPWLPPEPIDLIVQGYAVSQGLYEWTVKLSCSPASPWTVGVLPLYATVSEGFESAVPAISWTDGGDLPWVRDDSRAYSGDWSLRSGAITDGQTSDMVIAVPAGAATLHFHWWISSEQNFDHLRILVDGVEIGATSGVAGGWLESAELDVAGAATVTLRYVKDAADLDGEDAVWVDDIRFTLATYADQELATDRADTAGSELAAAVTAAATTLSVATTTGPVWTTDAADLPIDLRVGGEVVTVTAITGASSPQTMTVTRSVNAISKPHAAGADIRLAVPMIIAL